MQDTSATWRKVSRAPRVTEDPDFFHPTAYSEAVWFELWGEIATSKHMEVVGEVVRNAARARRPPEVAVELARQAMARIPTQGVLA